MKRDFLTLLDCSASEIDMLIGRAGELKAMQKRGKPHHPIKGKTVGLLFNKPSTRTKLSFEVGIYQLGGNVSILNPDQLQIGRGETIQDTARVISRYLDGLVIRTGPQSQIEEFARHSTIPIINGLTDEFHPCQIVGDLLTIREIKGDEKRLKIVYVGDGNNIANTVLCAAAVLGLNVVIVSPQKYSISKSMIAQISKVDKKNWKLTSDIKEGVTGADVIMTDVWVSMGQEGKSIASKKKALRPYQINNKIVALAAPDAIVMHCLPAHKGEEITEEVFEGPKSVVFDQAENRLHVQKAILEWLL